MSFILKRIVLALSLSIATTVVAFQFTGAAGADIASPTRDSLIAALRHHEGMVRTGSCTFVVKVNPTGDEAIAQIRNLCRARGNVRESDRYITSEKTARMRDVTIRWHGDGTMERYERFTTLPDVGTPPSGGRAVETFDGHVVRTLSQRGDQVFGRIDSIESSNWNSSSRLGGYSLLFKYYDSYLSDLIEKSGKVELSALTLNGARNLRVVFEHPMFTRRFFELVFDDRLRLVRRSMTLQMKDFDAEPRLYESHEFGEYKEYKDEHGNVIDFPSRAIYRYFMGVDPATKTPIEYESEEIVIKDIVFNHQMPRDLFTLEFPERAKIYDGLTGAGWLGGPPQRSTGTSEPVAKRSLLTWFIVGNVVFLTALLIVVISRRLGSGSRHVT